MNSETYYISSFCHIKNNQIRLNGEPVFSSEGALSDFLKAAYKEQKVNYPKFFKMDTLSKLAFMAAEVVFAYEQIQADLENDIALVFANRASSLDTDRKHQSTIDDEDNYFPSPAIFVYTLPNICLGEISIKYKLYSENSFFIFNQFSEFHFWHYAQCLLKEKKADSVLCGWVNVDEGAYEAFVYLVTKEGVQQHTEEQINTLYNKTWTL